MYAELIHSEMIYSVSQKNPPCLRFSDFFQMVGNF